MPKVGGGERYLKRYSEEDLQKAIAAIENGMAKREAAKRFSVPRATLQFRLSDRYVKPSHGPPTVLSSDEEKLIVDWIKECHRKGFPRRKEDVQTSVKQFLDDKPRKNPFNDNFPGDGWYKAFLRRHPEIAVRKPEAVTAASAKVSEKDIKNWFQDITQYLDEKSFRGILQNPERIFNGDETNFLLCPQTKKVLAPKGSRNVYEVDSGQAKAALTVMFTFSAVGVTTPPLIIYPYKRLPKDIAESVPEEFNIACSDTGWMKREIFYEYIGNTFYPYVKSLNIDFPIILFVDGHKTHLDRKLSELCTRLDIILISLYPNATRILQPADVSTFKPLKDGWKKGLLKWRRSHPSEELTKKHFADILKCVIETSVRPEIIINGFRACGLYPWDPYAIDYTKCLGKISNKQDNTNQIETTFQESATLPLKRFLDIVGPEKVKKFRNFCIDSDDESPEMKLLYRLWKEFESHSEQEKDIINKTDVPCNMESENNESVVEMLDNSVVNVNKVLEGIDAEFPNVEIEILDRKHEDETMAFTEYDILNMPIVMSMANNNSENQENELLDLQQEAESLRLGTSRTTSQAPSNRSSNLEIDQLKVVPLVTDASSAISTCVPSINDCKTLQNYLYYPDTPERKGKKNTERKPFIITSSGWKRLTKEKEEVKQKALDDKENRKRDREAKRLQKEKEVAMKKMRKQKSCRKNSTNVESKEVKKINIISNLVLSSSNKEHGISNSTEKSKNSIVVSSEREKIERVTRNLFLDETDDGQTLTGTSNILFRNKKLVQGLCYSCAKNATKENPAVKCDRSKCLRSYHLRCIERNNLHKSNSDYFTCLPCLKKSL